ncbi:hypothetical protein [Marinobacter salicampi]|uniref:hypothetical protein n=1 Tax=Marinobacter salicampi TaxID=435907 RepID=UPI00140C35AD|nr:hypothetical protein [Marinobacter salicampi]
MKLIRSVDLTAYDLIRIEHSFFAAPKVRRLLSQQPSSLVQPHQLAGHDADAIVQLVRNGNLLLVHDSADGLPFSPAVCWTTVRHGSDGGQWRLARELSDPILKTAVADLNRWEVTAAELHSQGPGGIGLYPADRFGVEAAWRRNEERYRKTREASRRPVSSRPFPTIADARLVAD